MLGHVKYLFEGLCKVDIECFPDLNGCQNIQL